VKYGKIEGELFHEKPMKFIAVDICGPLKTKHFKTSTEHEYFYILTIVDISTR
jgi:hypothetical protein